MVLAERIKEARKKAGLTQKELGERMGVSSVAVTQYESGQRVPKVDTLQRIADAIGIPFGDLLGIGTLIDGVYTQEEMKQHMPAKPTPQQVGQAYEKATPPVQRTVEVALEPFMDKTGDEG